MSPFNRSLEECWDFEGDSVKFLQSGKEQNPLDIFNESQLVTKNLDVSLTSNKFKSIKKGAIGEIGGNPHETVVF